MLGAGASAVYDYFSPDYYSQVAQDGYYGGYSPDQWSEWYERSQTYGTPEFAKHQDFVSKAQPRYERRLEEFLKYAEQRQQEDPSYGEGWGVFWDEFYGPMVEEAAKQKVLGAPVGPDVRASPEAMQAADAMVSDFFGWLKDTSLFGEERPDTSVTQEQMDEFERDPDSSKRMNAEWRMSPAGQEAYAKLLDYNFLNAFQEGEHRPDPLQSQALSTIGAFFGGAYENMTARVNNAQMGMPSLSPAFVPQARQGERIGRAQFDLVNSPSPGNALEYVNQVDQFAATQDPEFYNTWLMGSAVPQMSLMSPTGLDNKTFSGNTGYGRLSRSLTDAVMMNNYNRAERGAFTDFMNANDRGTPVRPAGMAEESEAAVAAGREIERDNWKQVSARFPMWIRSLNSMIAAQPQVWGGETPTAPSGMKWDNTNPFIGPQAVPLSAEERQYEKWRATQPGVAQPEQPDPDPYAKIGITPFVPSAFVNDAAMVIPGILGDPANAVSTAVVGPLAAGMSYAAGAGPAGSFINSLRAMLANNASDLPGETAFNTAITLGITPQTPGEYLSQSDPGNPVVNSQGVTPAADTNEYRKAFEEWENKRQEGVTNAQNVWRKQQSGIRKATTSGAITRP